MEVTDIRLGLATKEGGTKAFGSFSLDGAFAVRGISYKRFVYEPESIFLWLK